MKRLLQSAKSAENALRDDKVMEGLLQYRNTPDTSSGASPAQILFGRPLRDAIPMPPGSTIFENPHTSSIWREVWKAREGALRIRFGKQMENQRRNSRKLPALKASDKVQIQNQHGRYAGKWDRTGSVVEVGPHDQYLVRVDGSGRVTRRNRKALKRIVAFEPVDGTYTSVQAPLSDAKRPQGEGCVAGEGTSTDPDMTPELGWPLGEPLTPSTPSTKPEVTEHQTLLKPDQPPQVSEPARVSTTAPESTISTQPEAVPIAPMPQGITPSQEKMESAQETTIQGDDVPPLRRSTRVRRPPQFYVACLYCGQPGIGCTMEDLSFKA